MPDRQGERLSESYQMYTTERTPKDNPGVLVMSWPENQGILFFLYISNIANEPDIFHGFPP